MVQYFLIAGQVNVDITWLRDEVLVSGLLLPYYTYSSRWYIVILLLVNHPQWHVTAHIEQGLNLGKDSWPVKHRF